MSFQNYPRPLQSNGRFRQWLLESDELQTAEIWNSRIASLLGAESLAKLWAELEPLLAELIPARLCGLFVFSRELAPPAVVFSTGGYWESMPRDRMHAEMSDAPVLSILAERPGIQVIRWADHNATNDDYVASRHFQTHLRNVDLRYPMGLVFWQKTMRPQAIIGLFRSGEDGDFTDEEESILRRLHPILQQALRLVLERQRARLRSAANERILRDSSIPQIIASLEGNVVFANRAAREMLGRCSGKDDGTATESSWPSAIRNVIDRRRVALRQDVRLGMELSGHETEEVVDTHADAVRARVRVLGAAQALPYDPLVWISFEQIAAARDGAKNSSLLDALTLREREVADCVLEGPSNEEIAQRLGKSLSTVKAQLNRIYEKLDVPNRQKLLARLR